MLAETSNFTFSILAAHGVLGVLVGVSGYSDWQHRKIYNKVTVPAWLLGLVIAAFGGFPESFLNAFLASSLAFGVFYFMFAAGYIGGGDVKLATAVGALLGFPLIVDALFWGIISGGIYACIILLRRGELWTGLKTAAFFVIHFLLWRKMQVPESPESEQIPYGVCIGAGVIIALICKYAGYPSVLDY